MAKINKVMVGESLVGDGNEVAHIDLIIGPRGSAAETAFCNALTNNKDGFTSLLAVIAPNLACKPNTAPLRKLSLAPSPASRPQLKQPLSATRQHIRSVRRLEADTVHSRMTHLL